MKGKPVFPKSGGCNPKRGKGNEGMPEPKPKRKTAYLIFQQVARRDMYNKLGGKEVMASELREKHQLTSKRELPRGGGAFALCAFADMWKAAPEIVKEGFGCMAREINAREEQIFTEQQLNQQRHQPNKHSCFEARWAGGRYDDDDDDDDDDDSGGEPIVMLPPTASDSEEDETIMPSVVSDDSDSDSDNDSDSDSETDTDTCSDSEAETETDSDSENGPIMSSRAPPNGCGPAAAQQKEQSAVFPRAAATAAPASHSPAPASEPAQTKDRVDPPSAEKQLASKPVPLVSRVGLDFCGAGGVAGPAVGAASRPPPPPPPPPASISSGRGSGHATSSRAPIGTCVDSSTPPRVPTPSAEAKSPRPEARGTKRGGDAKDSGEPEPGAGEAGRHSTSPAGGEPPDAAAEATAGSKTSAKRTKRSKSSPRKFADGEMCDAGKRAGFDTEAGPGSAQQLRMTRSRMMSAAAAAAQPPRKKGPAAAGRRAASLDGRASETPSSSVSTPGRKRRASFVVAAAAAAVGAAAAAIRTEAAAPGDDAVASRTKFSRRGVGAEAEAGLPHGTPSASKRRNSLLESPAAPPETAAGRGDRDTDRDTERGGGRISTRTEASTPNGRTAAVGNDNGLAAGEPAAAAAAAPTTTPRTLPVARRAKMSASTAIAGAGRRASGGGSVRGGGHRNGHTREKERGRGGCKAPGNDQTDSGEGAPPGESSTRSDDESQPAEEQQMDGSADGESVDMGGDRPSDGGGDGDGDGGVNAAAIALPRLTHKKKVWHAGRSTQSAIFFGLARKRKTDIEVLWEVDLEPSGQKEKMWLPASVDLVDMSRMDNVIGYPLWNIRYERYHSIPASKSQVAFLSANKLRDTFEWNEENECWEGQPLTWRSRQAKA